LAWEEVVAHGGGALGAVVEADMRSGGAGARREQGRAGAYLVGRAVGTGGRRMKESNTILTR